LGSAAATDSITSRTLTRRMPVGRTPRSISTNCDEMPLCRAALMAFEVRDAEGRTVKRVQF